jgi:acetyl-CoA acetyltransferase family protein
MPRSVVVAAGLRTPFCRAGTAFKKVPAQELGRIVVAELVRRTEIPIEVLDHVIFGNCGHPADAANIARVIALQAGVPRSVPALTVHRNCASGLEAVALGAQMIRSGRARAVLVGGVESMSNYPLLYPREFAWFLDDLQKRRTWWQKLQVAPRFRPAFLKPQVGLIQGLTDPTCGLVMGLTAENIAREFLISRESQDEFSARSHQRALRAWQEETFREEVLFCFPPPDFPGVGRDVGPREEASREKLSGMKPYFDRVYGTVTVGNSCQITDGAVALILAEEKIARTQGWPILGRILSYHMAGLDPARMGLGPVFAVPGALKRAGCRWEEIDRIEINEAFAAQVLACAKAFDSRAFARQELGLSAAIGPLDPAKTNVHGGAIALGHPVGATGARLVLTLLLELQRSSLRLGLATLCVGGGQGAAMVVERVS